MRNTSFLRRFTAAVIDLFVIGLVSSIVITVFNVNTTSAISAQISLFTFSLFAPAQLVFCMLMLFYFTAFEYSGYTVGKAVFKIHVVDKFGRQISLGRSFLRNLVKLISFSFLGIGFFIGIFNRRGMTLHDYVADTRVIDVLDEIAA